MKSLKVHMKRPSSISFSFPPFLASLPPHVIHFLMLSSPPTHLCMFQVLRLDAMKGTSAQSLTQKYPERGMEGKKKQLERLKKKRKEARKKHPGRQNESNRITSHYAVDFSDRHWNQDWERKSGRLRWKESHYCTLCSATVIATTGYSALWLVLHNLAQKGTEILTLSCTHAPGNTEACNPHSIVHTLLHGHLLPHLHAYIHANTPTQSNSLVCHSTSQLSHMKQRKRQLGWTKRKEWGKTEKCKFANKYRQMEEWDWGERKKENPERIYFNETEIVFLVLEEGGFLSVLKAIYARDSYFLL